MPFKIIEGIMELPTSEKVERGGKFFPKPTSELEDEINRFEGEVIEKGGKVVIVEQFYVQTLNDRYDPGANLYQEEIHYSNFLIRYEKGS